MNEIIVGVDGSPRADVAARRAAELAVRLGQPLHIVMAVPKIAPIDAYTAMPETWHAEAVEAAKEIVASLAGDVTNCPAVTHAVVTEKPARALCSEASRLHASTIVVGNKRVQGAGRVLGSVASEVLRHAPCEVLIVSTGASS